MLQQRNKKTWIWLILLLIIFIFASFIMFSQKPKSYPNYVSDSPSPTGVKALYTYLHQHYETVNRWTHAPTLLNKGAGNQLLIIVEPFFMPTTEEIDEYKEFMNTGNSILLFSKNPEGYFDLKSERLEENLSDKNIKIKDQNGTTYKGKISSSIRLQTNKQDTVLLHDKEGVIAFKRAFGDGHLIISITPEWLTNGQVLSNDNVPLFLSLINEEKGDSILFDEYLHKGENASSIWTVYPNWFLILMLQILVLSVLWLWAKGKRFGPILVPREETVRFSDEGIKALAAWYSRGQRYHESLLIQADYIKQLLQERYHIPSTLEWFELEDLFQRKRLNITDIQNLKDIGSILQKDRLTKQEYILWSKRLDRLREEVVRR
ncbi:DUF4350 domain-containing protein [Bacillus sp. FJAT-49732]|uniref:DUF4350 domain-containing protein n=1 Tax=Lederbergia citrisecunda TaxID=2833583 RepID=A0A942YJD7_9BACI|nr:DUF4350 domain-containing protein [Lederbergia citrisecunda]MBS4199248.1 DUF4350 domain-containing protein [Lederbergia citrisecunda]